MAMPAPWIEDAVEYAGAGVTGLAVASAVEKTDPKDTKRVLYALAPTVVGAVGAAFLSGVGASLAQGIALGGVASLGWVIRPFVMGARARTSTTAYYPFAYAAPTTGFVSGRGIIEI